MNLPIALKLNDTLVANITSFSYETPWASGTVEFTDKALFHKLVSITTMSFFDLELAELELSDAEEERLWEAKLAELNLTYEDLKLEQDNRWTITPKDNESQPIYAANFYQDSFMDWRL